MASDNTTSGGIGFWGLLQILFIGLKLTNTITWSWWWVLSPTLFSVGFALIIVLSTFLYFLFKTK